ncbi:MAG: hypothetical protein NC342_08485 [Pseudoflavonifractor sp.]|nr:hypothetical protein [Alloprevotella sp.]MCM1117557.1 hypothetical protein [Pseudoflavonifractor sp.]
MTNLKQEIMEAVAAFTANDLAYTDNALIVIDPKGHTATILDPDEEADVDAIIEADPDHDYVAVMDLVETDDDGSWLPDVAAIDELLAEY